MNISKVINYIINQIHSPIFIEQHKFRIQDFTRDGILNFQILFVTIMHKSIKSLQNSVKRIIYGWSHRNNGYK